MASAVFTDAYRSFVENLISARKSAGLTQVQLAERLGKPQSYISKIERSERRIDVIEFCAWALALGHRPSELLGAIEAGLPRDLEI
jgi:transcriptional regulator with XRE-family HTH domain